MVLALLNGVAKLKVSGAEKRAFAKWSEYYEKAAQAQYDPVTFLKIDSAFMAAVSLLGTIISPSVRTWRRSTKKLFSEGRTLKNPF